MAATVTGFEEIVAALEEASRPPRLTRFLSVPAGRSVGYLQDVIDDPPEYGPRPGFFDVFAGRVLTFGWASNDRGARLDLRIQVHGHHNWPLCPVVMLWQITDILVAGAFLAGAAMEGFPGSSWTTQVGYGDSACTTFRASFATARLLQGAS